MSRPTASLMSREIKGAEEWSGGSGIRTHGGLHLTAFQEPRICPLCHPSGRSNGSRITPASRALERRVQTSGANPMGLRPT